MKMELKNIITLFILLLSLTSCKDKDKKYHWIAEVKAVSGYPVLTPRGFVYNKEDVSRFGTSRSSVFQRKEPFPHFAIDAGVGGLAASAEREVAKYENKLKYEIPEAVFKDKDNWKTGDFYYETGVKTIYGIIATITAGKSIFWKLSKK